MKKQTIKKTKQNKQTKNTKLNRSSFGVTSLQGGLKNKKNLLKRLKLSQRNF